MANLAPGPHFHNKPLQQLINYTSLLSAISHLSGLFHSIQSIQHYSLPAEWKIHCFTPIFESGEKNSVTNYRPISSLCIISKVLEQLIYNKVIACIYTSISTHQFGFMKGCSTLQQLLIFLNSIHEHSKAQTDVIYLDFAKAFDRVPHNELLLKL